LLNSCGSTKQFISDREYNTPIFESSGLKVTVSDVSETDGIFKVSGKLTRANFRKSYKGHVDIAIISPDNEIIDKASVEFSPKFGKIRKNKISKFRAEFKNLPPKGSVIRAVFHDCSNVKNEQNDCGANKACDFI
jgi:hypothetical protein